MSVRQFCVTMLKVAGEMAFPRKIWKARFRKEDSAPKNAPAVFIGVRIEKCDPNVWRVTFSGGLPLFWEKEVTYHE